MRRVLAWALGALLLAGLGGCASSEDLEGSLSEGQAQRIIETALADIENIYYRETRASEVVEAGLEGIQLRYPAVHFAREGDTIVAAIDRQSLSRLSVQDDSGAAREWAEQLAPALARIAVALEGENKPDLTDLTDAFLHGLTDGLDLSTTYVSPREASAERQRSQGRRGILSIRVRPEDNGQRIIQVYNATALASGVLRRGDLIVEIDGVPTAGISKDIFHDLIRGAVGSPIVLTILRSDGTAPLTVTLQRESDDANTIAVLREGNTQRIAVPRFFPRTADDLQNVLHDLKNDPQPAEAIILDLRSNPGGHLDPAISAGDFFLREGQILTTRGRHKESHQVFSASSKPPAIAQPLVVLVDESSAAGSEIVAAALQDNGRALVVGVASCGQGTIQTALPTSNGGEFVLTWTEMRTPAGYRLQGRGVMPTVCTGGDVTAEAVLADLRRGAGVIAPATRNQDIDPDDDAAVAAFRALCPPRSDGDDISLEVAEAILADPALYAAALAREQQTLQPRTAGN